MNAAYLHGASAVRWALATAGLMLFCGCRGIMLAPAPSLFLMPGEKPFDGVPAALRGNKVEVLYATDRKPEGEKNGSVAYGILRSPDLYYGICTVSIDGDMSWDRLVRESTTDSRPFPLTLCLSSVKNCGEFRTMGEGEISRDKISEESLREADGKALAELHRLLRSRLALTPDKRVDIFIHGFANGFDHSVFTAAQIWHFLGRRGVPVAYSWPAGHGGLVRGYSYDRESGEFTVYHLKWFLMAVASCPEVKAVNIISHSRGTDVAMTALREIFLECRGAGRNARAELKLDNLVLAAPDLDLEVAQQRIGRERLSSVAKRCTVYISPGDRALAFNEWVFGSIERVGGMLNDVLPLSQRRTITAMRGVDFINVPDRMDFLGHSYFIWNPAVLSDLVLLLRDDRAPGAENGRPLGRREDGFWELPRDYPRAR